MPKFKIGADDRNIAIVEAAPKVDSEVNYVDVELGRTLGF